MSDESDTIVTAVPDERRTPTRLALRRLNADDVKLRNAVGAGRHATVRIGHLEVRLDVRMAAIEADMRDEASACFDTSHGLINLRPAGPLVRLLSGIDLPGETPEAGPQADTARHARLRGWALAAALERLPDDWRRLFAIDKLVSGAVARDEASVALLVRVPGRDASLGVRLSGSADALAGILSEPSWQRGAAPLASSLDAFPIRGRIVAATARLSVREFRKLAVGDVIFTDESMFNNDGAGTVWFGRIGMRGRLLFEEPSLSFQFDEWRIRMDDSNPDNAPDHDSEASFDDDFDDDFDEHGDDEAEEHDGGEEGDDGGSEEGNDEGSEEGNDEGSEDAGGGHDGVAANPDLDNLPLRVVFEVAMLELPFGDVRELAEGTVIDLGRPTPPSVVIRCNGLDIGRGELVEIEGRLAVEIIELRGRDDQ